MGKIKPHRGEVWWVNFDPSIGSEVEKVRPAIVVSNDQSNKHLERIQVVPLTSNTERVYPGESLVMVKNKSCKAMTNQLATVSLRRLSKKYTALKNSDLVLLEQALRLQLGLG